jgi:uncharacterized integral membrane protein
MHFNPQREKYRKEEQEMTATNRIRIKKGAFIAGVSLSGAYLLCVILDFMFPTMAMKVGWATLLPWLSWSASMPFFSGLVGAFVIGVVFTVMIASIYNFYFFLRDKLEEIQALRYNDRLKYFWAFDSENIVGFLLDISRLFRKDVPIDLSSKALMYSPRHRRS